jgi:hypothetical protein
MGSGITWMGITGSFATMADFVTVVFDLGTGFVCVDGFAGVDCLAYTTGASKASKINVRNRKA